MTFSENCKKEYLNWYHHYCRETPKWMGVLTLKTPFDAWVFQEIVFDTKPTVIVEIGNKHGGSALFLAGILDSMGFGKIFGIDINHKEAKHFVKHERIEWITGDATDEAVFEKVKKE